ncbi:hypothetical protein G5B38_03085 [Pseudohalocynthiibacter aestuariivivens]|nr:hypothetical protein [Pseudohalocynthiibacter aestuariivivens]QIE44595.1 hypothetical protein G5B38_03085 [Pseudohalocynthiibacter aestuariivivens]
MNRILTYSQVIAASGAAAITLFGLASALLADPTEEAKELVAAYYEAIRSENWDAMYLQFNEDAEITITTNYGHGSPPETVSFAASEWNSLPASEYWTQETAPLEAYTELSRTVEIVATEETEDGVLIRAVQSIRYKTPDYEGMATEADSVLVSERFGRPVILSFTSIHSFQ